ncbi:hypothetical protein CNMCM5793_006744 [Aspergillus hiratsukae]|uniref:Carrier domain-containing protein n=1 Tax=Aspergillus hiratsukae TaxID=1194566 RepID=A0A8H6V4I5_9EURO|nr:hypothetical protein CNMCM5793_006744 [Aspergillus hiratsukae]KAF7173615.1 hypothetical protein CNMCM6106_007685 [Aspergillus hiratsukae]
MYTSLVNGGSVYIIPWSKHGDPIKSFNNLKKASSWRFGFSSSEPPTPQLLKQLASLNLPNLQFFNSYSPTKISISSTKMELKPVPVGMPGDLWISGAGVSLGYLNNKELTDYHFVHDPHVGPEYVAQGWTRMYRTGNITHLQDDSAMILHSYVARDSQVKIHSLHIKLGDIDSNIVQASNDTLREAAVTLRSPQCILAESVESSSCPTIHGRHHGHPARQDATQQSQQSGPEGPQGPSSSKPAKSAQEDSDELSETMIQLRQVWEEILKAKPISISITPSTSFFNIGGNSLLIVRLQSFIRSVFNVTVRLVDLLGGQHPRCPDVAKILCIGLRENPAGTPRQLAVSSDKIITHAGDLSEPSLGLSESIFWGLVAQVDSILHMGAVRSFWDNYQILRQSNVALTKKLIELAAVRRVPIHYISTAGLLSKVAAQEGVPVSIHRFVPAKTASTESMVPALQHFTTFVDSLSVLPDLNSVKGHFEMTPVSKAAGTLANALIATPAERKIPETPEFLHHEWEVRIDISEMVSFLENKGGGKGFKTVPVLGFIGRMKAAGL